MTEEILSVMQKYDITYDKAVQYLEAKGLLVEHEEEDLIFI